MHYKKTKFWIRFEKYTSPSIQYNEDKRIWKLSRNRNKRFRWLNLLVTLAAIFFVSSTYHWITASIANNDWAFNLYCYVEFGIGIFLSYKVLTGFVNKTRITINHQNFIVKIVPLPWKGNQNLNTSDIVQLYIKPIRATGNNRRVYFTYEVHGILKNRTHLQIIKSINQSEHDLFFVFTLLYLTGGMNSLAIDSVSFIVSVSTLFSSDFYQAKYTVLVSI